MGRGKRPQVKTHAWPSQRRLLTSSFLGTKNRSTYHSDGVKPEYMILQSIIAFPLNPVSLIRFLELRIRKLIYW